jgi:hypothetical protein
MSEEVSQSATPSRELSQDNPKMGMETMALQAMQIITGNQYNPTTEQVDKMLALQEKSMDYAHKDIHTFLPKDILEIGKFIFVILVGVGLFVFATYEAEEYLSEIASALLGLLAGGGIGYGYGSKKRNNGD